MIWLTPARGRTARRAAAALGGVLLLATGTACTGDEGEPGPDASATSSRGAEAAAVTTTIRLRDVGRTFGPAKRERVKSGVVAVVDPWIDQAFLGDFPRSDYSAAFAGFTPDAAADAQGRDLALLTNQAIADQISTATASRRRVLLDVLIHQRRARGATAHVVLDFDTTGGLEGSRRVVANLYLVRDAGAWRIFGYDVDQAVAR